MAPQTIQGINSGQRITVSQMSKSPTLIPKRILSTMDQEFLVDAVLRKGSDAPSGIVLYFESTPLFSNDSPQIMDEFGEIPTTNGSLGQPRSVRTVRRALGLRISKQMISRNDIDAVNLQVTQIRNTMVRSWEDAFFTALISNPNVQAFTASSTWTAGGTIRKDINAAKYLIQNAASDSNYALTQAQGLYDATNGINKFGFNADTLIISTETQTDFLSSTEINGIYTGNLADQNLLYTGKLPNKFLGLDVLVSWRLSTYLPVASVVLERKTVGFISDERELSATPLYGEGNGPNGGPREAFRTDITRQSAIGIDQPLAAVIINGTVGQTNSHYNLAI